MEQNQIPLAENGTTPYAPPVDRNAEPMEGDAYSFLQSLKPYKHDGDRSAIINNITAKTFTDQFRTDEGNFQIPISWTMTKDALLNLLGITDYTHYPEVNGVRFYAGINEFNEMTLIAVSTKAGIRCNDDLTIDDTYPYYDYADPCPNNCSNIGNLSATGGDRVSNYFTRVK